MNVKEDLVERIARYLCAADGYDPDVTGVSGGPRWWLYVGTAGHVVPLLADAWDEGFRLGDGVGTYIASERDEFNPYRQETTK